MTKALLLLLLLLFIYFFFILLLFFFYHSSLLTPHSIFITHHLKYPNFLYPPVWHTSLNLSSLNFFNFLWTPYLLLGQSKAVSLPAEGFISIFSLFSFPLSPAKLYSRRKNTSEGKNIFCLE